MSSFDEIIGHHIILPSQFYDSRSAAADSIAPIKRLMLAVLQDALECLRGRGTGVRNANARRSALEAAAWIEDANDHDLFSFVSVCDALGVESSAAREAIRAWLASGRRVTRRSPVIRQTATLLSTRGTSTKAADRCRG
jgi:hypothetical protein